MQRRCIGEQKKKKIVEKIKQARFEGVPVRCIWEQLLADDFGVPWEGVICDFSVAWDSDGSQSRAIIERPTSYTRHAVTNNH